MGPRLLIAIGAVSGLLAVAAGAFGAHALKARLDADLLQVFETGARYHLIHAVLIVVIGIYADTRPSGLADAAGISLIAGTVLFSGSLYVLALTGTRWLGAITPLGGLCFIAGWGLLAAAALRSA
jgi:uncharacterized membrane protein YgdD (TMEM256/DUF423 family)